MYKKLIKLMAEILGIREENVMDDLSIINTDSWDSLKHMELVVGVEQTFGIELTADEIVSMVDLSEIKRILAEKVVNI